VVLAAGIAQLGPAQADKSETGQPETIRIGLVKTLFHDLPEPMFQAFIRPFSALMEAQTGMAPEVIKGGDAQNLGRLLHDEKVQLGLLHGIEFAWAQKRYVDLRPLMIAVNQEHHLYAHLLVRADSKAAGLADLKGKSLALPRQTREHCLVFLRRGCGKLGLEPDRFFSAVTPTANMEEALDAVVDGKVQAVVVDNVSLDCYSRRKPGRFGRLRPLLKSDVFPATVIAYRSGGLDQAVCKRLRDGLVEADKTELGRQLLTLWQLTGFEPVPSDYDETVANIIKAYPPPE
jgi:ABC-type phosphate/phosphonate transport system substrate-binding protein